MEIKTLNPDDFETVYKWDKETEQVFNAGAIKEYFSLADLEERISSIQQPSNKVQQPGNRANEYKRLYFTEERHPETCSLQGPFLSQPSIEEPNEDGHRREPLRIIIPSHCFPLELYSLTRVYFGYQLIKYNTSYDRVERMQRWKEDAFKASLDYLKLPKITKILESEVGEYTVLPNNCAIFYEHGSCKIIGFNDNEVREMGENIFDGVYPSVGKGSPSSMGNRSLGMQCTDQWVHRGFAYNVHLTEGLATVDTFNSMKMILPLLNQ